MFRDPVIVDSYRFLPRSFRPYYEGRGPFHGEDEPVWAPFAKRLSATKIALLSSAGLYLTGDQQAFDGEREREHPEWGDPSWRSIPSWRKAGAIGAMHLHINTTDVVADPEIALPSRTLTRLAEDGVIGAAAERHYAVMGYQERSLAGWREKTAPEIIGDLRDQEVDGLILAPA